MALPKESQDKFTKFELARIIGARALQISMDAPLLLKVSQDELERIKYDPIKIAELELNEEVLPITVKRPFPEKREGALKRAKEKEASDEKKVEEEKEEEKEISEESEIMELSNPEDEAEEEFVSEEELE